MRASITPNGRGYKCTIRWTRSWSTRARQERSRSQPKQPARTRRWLTEAGMLLCSGPKPGGCRHRFCVRYRIGTCSGYPCVREAAALISRMRCRWPCMKRGDNLVSAVAGNGSNARWRSVRKSARKASGKPRVREERSLRRGKTDVHGTP